MKETKFVRDVSGAVALVLSFEIFHMTSGFNWHNVTGILVGVGAAYGVGCAYEQMVEGSRLFSVHMKSQYKDACNEWFDLLCTLYHSEKFLFEQDSTFPEPKYPADRAAKWISPDNPYNLEFRQRVALIKQMIEQVDERITNIRDARSSIQPVLASFVPAQDAGVSLFLRPSILLVV
jgi:hypothetical protein